MTAPANRWKLGMFVLGGLGLGVVGLAFLGARELRRASHTVHAWFDEALTGLEDGSPVKFRGVTVGVVDRIRVGPDKKHLEVEASLYDDYLRDLGLDVAVMEDCPLPEKLRAQIVMSWVTSTSFIQVDYFDDPSSGPQVLPFPVPPGCAVLRTVPSTAKNLEGAVRDLLTELPATAQAARDLIGLLHSELASLQLPAMAQDLRRLLDMLERQVGQLDEQRTIARATSALQAVESAAAAAVGALRADDAPLAQALRSWRDAGQVLQHEMEGMALGATTAELRAAATGVVDAGAELRAGVRRLTTTMAAVERLLALLERDPGALLHGRGPASPTFREPR